MKWERVLEAIVALPSLILEQIVSGFRAIALAEEELIANGEYDEEELDYEKENHLGEFEK